MKKIFLQKYLGQIAYYENQGMGKINNFYFELDSGKLLGIWLNKNKFLAADQLKLSGSKLIVINQRDKPKIGEKIFFLPVKNIEGKNLGIVRDIAIAEDFLALTDIVVSKKIFFWHYQTRVFSFESILCISKKDLIVDDDSRSEEETRIPQLSY